MKTLELKKENAIKAFKEADAKGKELLKNLFGNEPFSDKITDRIKTLEDVIEQVGIKEKDNISIIFDYNGQNKDMISIQAYSKLILVARVLNEGWTPNWDDSNESKYYPYFDMRSGVGFSGSSYAIWNTHTAVGSRLCFKSRELAEYAGKQFEAIYKDFLTL